MFVLQGEFVIEIIGDLFLLEHTSHVYSIAVQQLVSRRKLRRMRNALSHVGVIYLIYFQLIPASLILDPAFPGNRYQLPEADR